MLKASRKVEVHFVDFGNRETVECEELRDMPETILSELPVQAVACSLNGIEHTGSVSMWSPADIDTFSDMVYDHLLEVNITRSQSSDAHYLVHLLKDQENINRKFLRSTNKLSRGYMSPVDSMAGAGDASSRSSSSSLAKRRQSVDSNSTDGKDGTVARGYRYEELRSDEQLDCIAAYVVSPGQFCLHRASTDALDTMMDELNADYENCGSAHVLNVSIGEACCALFSEDGRWYRAKLTDISAERRRRLTVEFVDYGNRETVDASVVHRLRSHYFKLTVQALHCRLAGVVPATGSAWSDEASAFFEEVLGESVHQVKIVSKDESVHTVEMLSVAQKLIERGFAKGKSDRVPANITHAAPGGRSSKAFDTHRGSNKFEIISVPWQPSQMESNHGSSGSYGKLMSGVSSGGGGFAADNDAWPEHKSSSSEPSNFVPLDIVADTRHTVVVSWVVSPSEFYCQLVDNCRDIERLSTELNKTYQRTKDCTMTAADCINGHPCVAFYDADNSWYRARIVSSSSDRAKVLYVDYGNTADVRLNQVRRATAQFMKSPPVQAVRCCLRGSQQQASQWSKDKVSAFDKAASAPGMTCQFIIKHDDVYSVELSDQTGRDLTKEFCAKPTSTGAVSSKAPELTYVYDCGLKKGETTLLEVVYMAEGSRVFNCHVIGQTDELDELMTKLAKDCGRRPAPSAPAIGQPCAALYSEDKSWYRATVESVPADDASQRIVKFVDYGNIESCSVSSLRELDGKFLRVPVRRVDCRLHGMTASSLDAVADDLMGQQFNVTVVAVDSGNVLSVELKNTDTGESFAVTHPDLFSPTAAPSLPPVQPPDGAVDVYITHVISPSDFYVQTAAIEPQLTELVDQLVETYDAGDSDELALTELTIGSLCCAKYSVDEAWYRAVVEDIADDLIAVRFVDYGNSDKISRSDVRQLTDQFAAVPACAWHCQLASVSAHSGSWTDTERQTLVDLAEAGEKLFSCSFVSRSQSPYPVTLKDGDVDIGQQSFGTDTSTTGPDVVDIIAAPMSELPQAEPPSDLTEVYITSALSPSDFYVQSTSVEDELSELADELMGEYDSLSANECLLGIIKVGALCCARYSSDAAWYRAVITEIVSDSEVSVLFVDYGNTDTVSTSADVKLLSAKYCAKAAFAYRCGLVGVGHRTTEEWAKDVKTKFTQLTMIDEEVPAVFKCRFVSRNSDTSRHLVSLMSADDVDISSLLGVTPDIPESSDSHDQPAVCYQSAVISAGKHSVSILCLRLCLSTALYVSVCLCLLSS